MGLKIVAVIVGTIFACMVALRIMAARSVEDHIPLIALLCTSSREDADQLSVALQRRGLKPLHDYRIEIYACNAPNTIKEAGVYAATRNAKLIVSTSKEMQVEATRLKIPFVLMDPADQKASLDKVAAQTKAAMPKP